MDRAVGILIIGSEILSGKVADENSPFLCRELRCLGADVKCLAVLPDEAEAIAQQLRSWIGRYDVILTCGGVGPTPDDVTIEGVARALGRRVVRSAELEKRIEELFPPPRTEGHYKMAEIPEGAELLWLEGLRFPITTVSNIYILPGSPIIMQKKFNALKDRFRDLPYLLKKIYLNATEFEITRVLSELLAVYPAILLGSYPSSDPTNWQVLLTLESKDSAYLNQAFSYLMSRLPEDRVVKVE